MIEYQFDGPILVGPNQNGGGCAKVLGSIANDKYSIYSND